MTTYLSQPTVEALKKLDLLLLELKDPESPLSKLLEDREVFEKLSGMTNAETPVLNLHRDEVEILRAVCISLEEQSMRIDHICRAIEGMSINLKHTDVYAIRASNSATQANIQQIIDKYNLY